MTIIMFKKYPRCLRNILDVRPLLFASPHFTQLDNCLREQKFIKCFVAKLESRPQFAHLLYMTMTKCDVMINSVSFVVD